MPTQYGLYAAGALACVASASALAAAAAAENVYGNIILKRQIQEQVSANACNIVLINERIRNERNAMAEKLAENTIALARAEARLRCAEVRSVQDVRQLQESLDASVSALEAHCSENHRAAGAALRAENREILSDAEESLNAHVTAAVTSSGGAVQARVTELRNEMLQRAVASHDEATRVGDLTMRYVKLLEQRLDAMQHAADDDAGSPTSGSI